jgi:hypothetical protein
MTRGGKPKYSDFPEIAPRRPVQLLFVNFYRFASCSFSWQYKTYLNTVQVVAAAARLLKLWVRIPPWHECLSVVSVVCCQVEVSAKS